ncbi:dipeptidase [Brevibacterium album]|uniref:dipeptidase n=1 Tax=Brevibacterium album TaxID=417948 RepID=UPI00040B22DD|nr:dipeptidase [Brevibacterium album]
MTQAHTARSERATTLHSALDAVFEEVKGDLASLVAIPSIAWPAFDQSHVRASAEAVAALARKAGFEEVDVLTAQKPDGEPGSPAVVAARPAPEGAPTVVLYAHHDVQPTGEESLWNTPPFEATESGDRIFGRGAADDKAGIMVHLTALRLLGEDLGVGVVLFVEGEEEAGSPSFRDFILRHRDRLAGDVFVVADSGNWAAGTPALTTSLRGMAALEFTVSTLDHAVHSGMYGGVVPDAALAMTRLLASLHGEDGSVAVEGLVGETAAHVDYEEAALRADSGILDGVELIGTGTLASRVWSQPAVTVIGLDLPHVDVSSNTLQHSLRAKLSIRVAPGDTPENALAAVKRHLTDHAPFGARVEFGEEEAGSPWRADTADPVVDTAMAALGEGFGTEAVQVGLGGSIPFIADLLEVFPQASILVTGVEDPDARAHSANESLYVPDFRRAIVAEALLLERLGGRSAEGAGV